MIRRRSLHESGKRAPPTLKQREGRNRAVGNPAPVSIGNLWIFAGKLNFDDLGGSGGEKGEAERVTAGPGDGEATNRMGKAMVERVCRRRVSGEGDQSPVADGVRRHFQKESVLGFGGVREKQTEATLRFANKKLFRREIFTRGQLENFIFYLIYNFKTS